MLSFIHKEMLAPKKCPTIIFDEEMLCKWLCHLSKALFDEYGLILCQQQRQNNMCKPSIG
jgi:hypothetical protein